MIEATAEELPPSATPVVVGVVGDRCIRGALQNCRVASLAAEHPDLAVHFRDRMVGSVE